MVCYVFKVNTPLVYKARSGGSRHSANGVRRNRQRRADHARSNQRHHETRVRASAGMGLDHRGSAAGRCRGDQAQDAERCRGRSAAMLGRQGGRKRRRRRAGVSLTDLLRLEGDVDGGGAHGEILLAGEKT
ncbi:hypothetical protein GCM10009828_013100 [Actinoplanes couchii]|uniref:Uncharacterized protein n=1 Tax=Actinoplanes couchii TaxID=403638 RepID=A0ABQ3XJE5_9ACTN|nr:hypothetical protein Aco03nite_070210 [Actinoplanes couchii]